MAWLRSVLDRMGRTDEERLSEEVREWAKSVPDTRTIGGCPSREPVRITGVVKRLTVRPQDGSASLEALVTDGTGEMAAIWHGRSHIEGLQLGSRLVLKGVVAQTRHGRVKMVNPDFEFAA
jgi:RecG-like helicase